MSRPVSMPSNNQWPLCFSFLYLFLKFLSALCRLYALIFKWKGTPLRRAFYILVFLSNPITC